MDAAAIRAFLREYQRREGITQQEHAARLGISQPFLSMFTAEPPRKGMGWGMAQAAYRLHPELRPSLHAAVFGLAAEQRDAPAAEPEQVPA